MTTNRTDSRTIKVMIDGQDAYGYPGQKVLELAKEAGIKIPALCYDPHLSVHGGCSVCLVEIEGARALMRACTNAIAPGMVIRTNTERVMAARRLALELMLSDHVGDCRPPCNLICPAQGKVQSYINLTAQGKFREALDELHDHITLPASIGRVCPAPCQEKCRRNLVDETVSIREIKRFVADWGIKQGSLGDIPKIIENQKKIAVIGAGPAGLSCAYFARLLGYSVTIFEREQYLGGMMRYGIPDYRLPPSVLDAESQWILDHGVHLETGVALGRDIHLGQLRSEHDAVVLAMGCWKSSSMRVPGEELPGVVGGIDFLYTVNTRNPIKIGDRVAVVGGGNTAMDACRSARRLGSEKVYVVYRRTREEMPAEDVEIREAMEEGVEFVYLAAPKLIEKNGSGLNLVCERMKLGEADASGRRSPVPTGEEFTLELDTIIAAIGQGVKFEDVPSELHDGRRMRVDENYATPLSGVFVCGDQQTGAKIAIEAIGNGHFCALSVDNYLRLGTPKKPFVYDVTNPNVTEKDFEHIEKAERVHPREDDAQTRLESPNVEYNYGLDEAQALSEAKRCMECGCPDVHECRLREFAIDLEVHPETVAGEHISKQEIVNQFYVRNMDKCILCGRCVRVCDEVAGVHAIDFAKRGFESVIAAPFYKDMKRSDCTFCGLCVQVCPTGALMERRVERLPHQGRLTEVKTTCPHCPLGCELVLNLDGDRSRITRITSDLDAPDTPNRGLTCLSGRYRFKSVSAARLTKPSAHGKDIDWSEGTDKLSEIIRGKNLIFVGYCVTDQEIAAIKAVTALNKDTRVVVKGFGFSSDVDDVKALLASFETDTPKGKAKPDVAELVQKMTKLAKAIDAGANLAAFDKNLRGLSSHGGNTRGFLESGLPISTMENAIDAAKNGDFDSILFLDCHPNNFGIGAGGETKGAKKVLLSSNIHEGDWDLCLPITVWAEREGTYTSIFGNAKLNVRTGPVPPEGVRSLRWALSEALRKAGVDIASAAMAL
ncbi:glutamate synthase [Synergistales bacterium]|nr:glutamate synthase [Synergistales bacterium]